MEVAGIEAVAGGRLHLVVVFFFFQAEDGIRDADVTGVQTCALPICGWKALPSQTGSTLPREIPRMATSGQLTIGLKPTPPMPPRFEMVMTPPDISSRDRKSVV